MNQRRAGALLSYVYLALTFCVGLFYTPIALYFLGGSEFGVFAIATSAISFLTILDMGFNQTMIRYVARFKALNDKEGEERINGMFLIFYSVIALIALVVGFVLSFFIEPLFAGDGTVGLTDWQAWELRLIFIILLINLVGSFPLGIYTAILNANEGFVVLKLISIFTYILTNGGIILALFFGGGAITMAVITTSVSLVLKFIQGIYVQKKYRPKFRLREWDKGLFKEVFVFSFFIFLNIVIDQLYASTDKIILGIVQNAVVVTIYSVGVQFSGYFDQFSTSISGVFLPRITHLVTTEKDMKKVSEIFVRIGRIQFILLGFLMSGFIVFGRMFIGLWVGDEMGDAYAIALVVILPAIIPLSQNIGIAVIRAMNRHRFRSVMYLGIAVFNVGLSIPLAMYFGGFGAACATGLGTCLGQILTMNWFYWKRIGLDIPGYWRQTGRILVVLIPLGFVGWGIHLLPFWKYVTAMGGWLSFLLQGLTYCLVFAVVGWLFIFNSYEKDLIRSLVLAVVKLILRLRPLRDDILFESHPDFSDNAMAVYEELIRRGYNREHRIYWFLADENRVTEDSDARRVVEGVGELPENVFLIYRNKNGLRTVWHRYSVWERCRFIVDSNSYVRKLRRGQVRLHLGHGMPIKLLPEYTNYEAIGACDGYVICGNYWKKIYTEQAHIPEEVLVPIGYPRNDVLVEGSETQKLVESRYREETKQEHAFFWHLHEREKYILWMPTYRQHKKYAAERHADAQEAFVAADEGRWEVLVMQQLRSKRKPKMPFGMPEIRTPDQLKELDKTLGEHGIKLYFRPHPAQDLYYVSQVDLDHIRIADDGFLQRVGVGLYELLVGSEALITDYSSVYFDYLLTGKPIGLTLGDSAAFFREFTCCFDDLDKELGGVKLKDCKEVLAFVTAVAEGVPAGDEADALTRFHDVTDGTSTQKVLEWLAEHGMPCEEIEG